MAKVTRALKAAVCPSSCKPSPGSVSSLLPPLCPPSATPGFGIIHPQQTPWHPQAVHPSSHWVNWEQQRMLLGATGAAILTSRALPMLASSEVCNDFLPYPHASLLLLSYLQHQRPEVSTPPFLEGLV